MTPNEALIRSKDSLTVDGNIFEHTKEYKTIEKSIQLGEKAITENKFLKDIIRRFIIIDDSDLSHLKIKVDPVNTAVNQDLLKLLKEILEQ